MSKDDSILGNVKDIGELALIGGVLFLGYKVYTNFFSSSSDQSNQNVTPKADTPLVGGGVYDVGKDFGNTVGTFGNIISDLVNKLFSSNKSGPNTSGAYYPSAKADQIVDAGMQTKTDSNQLLQTFTTYQIAKQSIANVSGLSNVATIVPGLPTQISSGGSTSQSSSGTVTKASTPTQTVSLPSLSSQISKTINTVSGVKASTPTQTSKTTSLGGVSFY